MSDMSPQEFRRHGHEVVDWIAEFLATVGDRPVLPGVQPGDVTARLPARPPDHPEPMEDILRDFREILVPATTHWNHPSFHAYFSNTASGPGILGEALTAALNSNLMLWRTGPAATELEALVIDWVRQLLGLPDPWEGLIHDTASVATLVALATARHVATEGRVRDQGLAGGARLRAYCSADAHSSVEKAGIILGLGREGVRQIPVDAEYRMRPDALATAIAEDVAAGWQPFAVTATVGTTAATAVDPVAAIAELCREHGLWLHVDAAYAGPLAMLEEFAWIHEGVEHADSYVVNPHKWLFVPMDCSLLYSPRMDDIRAAFSLVPGYLATPEEGVARNTMDYGPALGRRNRALKLWMVLRWFGAEGIAQRLRHHVALARDFSEWIDADPAWERMAPARMSLVLYRHRPEGMDDAALDDHNRRILELVNQRGKVFLSQTERDGRFCLRFTIGNLRTQAEHVFLCREELKRAAHLALHP